jgi:hypothetical protein
MMNGGEAGALFYFRHLYQRSRRLAAPSSREQRPQFIARDFIEAHQHGGKALIMIFSEEFFRVG